MAKMNYGRKAKTEWRRTAEDAACLAYDPLGKARDIVSLVGHGSRAVSYSKRYVKNATNKTICKITNKVPRFLRH